MHFLGRHSRSNHEQTHRHANSKSSKRWSHKVGFPCGKTASKSVLLHIPHLENLVGSHKKIDTRVAVLIHLKVSQSEGVGWRKFRNRNLPLMGRL